MNSNDPARMLKIPMSKNDLVIIINENSNKTFMLEKAIAVT